MSEKSFFTAQMRADFRKLLYEFMQDCNKYGSDQHRILADLMVMEQWIDDRINDAIIKAGVANKHIRLEQGRKKN